MFVSILEQTFIFNLYIITMQEGTVKFFNNTKGFGFITSNDSGEDIFVHSSGLIDNIREDDKVKFNTEQGKKGLNAVNVEVVY
jgi:CspA family cold shock protein